MVLIDSIWDCWIHPNGLPKSFHVDFGYNLSDILQMKPGTMNAPNDGIRTSERVLEKGVASGGNDPRITSTDIEIHPKVRHKE